MSEMHSRIERTAAMVAEGLTDREIARVLHVSERTVGEYRRARGLASNAPPPEVRDTANRSEAFDRKARLQLARTLGLRAEAAGWKRGQITRRARP